MATRMHHVDNYLHISRYHVKQHLGSARKLEDILSKKFDIYFPKRVGKGEGHRLFRGGENENEEQSVMKEYLRPLHITLWPNESPLFLDKEAIILEELYQMKLQGISIQLLDATQLIQTILLPFRIIPIILYLPFEKLLEVLLGAITISESKMGIELDLNLSKFKPSSTLHYSNKWKPFQQLELLYSSQILKQNLILKLSSPVLQIYKDGFKLKEKYLTPSDLYLALKKGFLAWDKGAIVTAHDLIKSYKSIYYLLYIRKYYSSTTITI